MPALQVRDVPSEVHQRLRERAREERMSLGEYVLELIERDLSLPTRREWAERLATRAAVATDAATAIEAGRKDRDDELAEAHRH